MKLQPISVVTLLGLIFLVSGNLEDELNQILNENKGLLDRVKEDPPDNSGKESYNSDIPNLDPSGNDGTTIDESKLLEKPENVECTDECVPFYQCKNGSVITSGEGLIDIRSNDGPCGNSLLHCCKLEDITSDQVSAPKPDPVAKLKGCGYSNPNGVGFQITGTEENEAQFAEFPWMVSLYKVDGKTFLTEKRPSCGGALIHPQAAITAAHCVAADKKQRWRIQIGDWDINRNIEPIPHQVADVDAITIHNKFNAAAAFNDIAFLHLRTPIKDADNVGTICLPPQNFNHKKTRCFSAGWGKDKFGREGKFVDILKKIDLPFIPRQVCQNNLRKTRLGAFFQLHPSFMCAGGEKGKDACNGDGGGPLVCPIEKGSTRYYQAGIVSWGVGCGEENVPGIYTDVAKFRSWIDRQMSRHGLQQSTYLANSFGEPRK